jgi:glycosyltransferase involved in cell wall biosynthesis
MILITVIITTYNSESTLGRTLNSVVNQIGYKSQFDLQIIVVDDHSQDQTAAIASNYGVEWHSFEKNSGGPNKGRNLGLQKAKGTYICILDHDDEWLPNKLLMQLNHVGTYKIISCGFIERNAKFENDLIYTNTSSKVTIPYKKNETFLAKLERRKDGEKAYLAGIMLHKDLSHLHFEEKYGMVDFDWNLKLYHENESIEVAEPLFIRYVGTTNLSLNEAYRLKDFTLSKEIISTYKHAYLNSCTKGLKRIHGSLARYYYLMGDVKKARTYFLKADFGLKTMLYYLTTYWGRKLVLKWFKVF